MGKNRVNLGKTCGKLDVKLSSGNSARSEATSGGSSVSLGNVDGHSLDPSMPSFFFSFQYRIREGGGRLLR